MGSQGLSTKQASMALSEQLDNLCNNQQYKKSVNVWTLPITIVSIISSILLIVFGVVQLLWGLKYTWIFPSSCIAEGVVVLVLTVISCWLLDLDMYHSAREILYKLQSIVKNIKELQNENKFIYPQLRNSVSAELTLVWVWRDGELVQIPSALLVQGDLIRLRIGDLAYGKCQRVDSESPGKDDGDVIERGRKVSYADLNGDLYGRFVLIETPVVEIMSQTLQIKYNRGLVDNQMQVLTGFFYKIMYVAVCLSFTFSVIKVILDADRAISAFGYLVINQIYVIMAVLPLLNIPLFIIIRSFLTGKILLLFERLQQSPQAFSDEPDVDQFDEEESAPVIDISYSFADIWNKFKNVLQRRQPLLTCDLLSNLATITSITYLDREGSLTSPFMHVKNLVVFDKDQNKFTELDMYEDFTAPNEISFADNGYRDQYVDSLKPLGLNLLLNTDCDCAQRISHHGSRRDLVQDYHRKYRFLSKLCKVPVSQQRCLCSLAKTIGFSVSAANVYQKVRTLPLIWKNYTSVKSVMSLQVQQKGIDDSSSNRLLLTNGELSLISRLCSDVWTGEHLFELDDTLRKQFSEIHLKAISHDFQALAFSYSPVDDDLQSAVDAQESTDVLHSLNVDDFNELYRSQILLGAAIFQPCIKADVKEFIEDLRLGGIRFVYFSRRQSRQSKAFADRLGLETDWNSCIILSKVTSPDDLGYVEPHDIKAKLPRGIDNIKQHLQDVDDIPLQVSLFADSNSESISSMISIFQEHGDIVLSVGNSLNLENINSFAQSDISIAVDSITYTGNSQYHLKDQQKQQNYHQQQSQQQYIQMQEKSSVINQPEDNGRKLFQIAQALVSLHSHLTMSGDLSPYVISQTVREARLSIARLIQAFTHTLAAQLGVMLLMLASVIMLLPPILTGFQILFITLMIIPILSMSFIFAPQPNMDSMKIQPLKNTQHLKDRTRFLLYGILRNLPLVAVSVVCYCIVLFNYLPNNPWQFSQGLDDSWQVAGSLEQGVLVQSQNVAMFSCVLFIVVNSASYMHRVDGPLEYIPFANTAWLVAAALCIVLTLIWCGCFYVYSQISLQGTLYILAVLLPSLPLSYVWNELIKKMDRSEYSRFQRRRKLEFNTKLGCYSPV
ncbi:hypothetical protein MP228_002793 [Amoeboaphelidium protococcarum]|nr:hypothetical protein MP228_002793 [Amoeboaphelidium protococcarum]